MTTSKEKIIAAAFSLIRQKGYSATTVDELCSEAGVTKGAFFHHFKTKEDLAIKAAKHWSKVTSEFFEQAPYHKHEDPLQRVLGYVDFRRDIIQGEISEFTCLVGTMIQETFESSPEIRNACFESISLHAKNLENDIAEAKKRYTPNAKWSVPGLALHTQAVIQGAFILVKAGRNPEIAKESIEHLKKYIELLHQK